MEWLCGCYWCSDTLPGSTYYSLNQIRMACAGETTQSSRSRKVWRQYLNHSFGTITATSKTLVSALRILQVRRTLFKALNTAWIGSLLLPLELVHQSLRPAALSPL